MASGANELVINAKTKGWRGSGHLCPWPGCKKVVARTPDMLTHQKRCEHAPVELSRAAKRQKADDAFASLDNEDKVQYVIDCYDKLDSEGKQQVLIHMLKHYGGDIIVIGGFSNFESGGSAGTAERTTGGENEAEGELNSSTPPKRKASEMG